MNLKRLFDFSPQARLWFRIALFMSLLGLLAAVGNGFGMGSLVVGFFFALGFFVLPFVALLLAVAALSEPYHLPRATLWACATGVLAGGSLAVSLALTATSETGAADASRFWYNCCLPILVLALGVGLYFIVRAWAEARQESTKTREAQALELIQARGVIALSDLAAELRLPLTEAEALAQSLVDNRTLFGGLFDAAHSTIYGAAALQAKLERLADCTKAQPEASLADLASRVQAPLDLVEDWLRQLAQGHRIAGYFDPDGRVFHRLAREQWDGIAMCPVCGAAWSGPSPAETGTTRCPQCASEVFI